MRIYLSAAGRFVGSNLAQAFAHAAWRVAWAFAHAAWRAA